MLHFEAGEQYDIGPCDEYERIWAAGTLQVGTTVTIYAMTDIEYSHYDVPIVNPFSRQDSPFLLIKAIYLVPFVKPQSEKHPCKCPSINFTWAGIGCQCGGT